MRSHGIASTYSHAGCRCAPCTKAHTDDNRRRIVQRAARLAADPTLAPHGSASTYRHWRCRCQPCVKAHSSACARYSKALAVEYGRALAAIARGGQP